MSQIRNLQLVHKVNRQFKDILSYFTHLLSKISQNVVVQLKFKVHIHNHWYFVLPHHPTVVSVGAGNGVAHRLLNVIAVLENETSSRFLMNQATQLALWVLWLESPIAFPKSPTCRVKRKKEPLTRGLISSVKKSSSMEWYQCRKHTHDPLQPKQTYEIMRYTSQKNADVKWKGEERKDAGDR